jgi:hypothetical protein
MKPAPVAPVHVCHHDGTFSGFNRTNTWRVGMIDLTTKDEMEVGVCKFCGVVTDVYTTYAEAASMEALAGDSKRRYHMWGPIRLKDDAN